VIQDFRFPLSYSKSQYDYKNTFARSLLLDA